MEDLTECAELGVSELVTNALLHGEPPIQVRVRGTVEHPRIEVRDSSLEAPVLPTATEMDEHDELLLTYGRGLCAGRAQRGRLGRGDRGRRQGRVVRAGRQLRRGPRGARADHRRRRRACPPRADPRPGPRARSSACRCSSTSSSSSTSASCAGRCACCPSPTRATTRSPRASATCSRPSTGTCAKASASSRSRRRSRANRTHTDLVVHMPRATARTLSRFIELLDLADDFCRQQRLLALARTAGAASLPELVPRRVRPAGRGRGARSPGPRPQAARRTAVS